MFKQQGFQNLKLVYDFSTLLYILDFFLFSYFLTFLQYHFSKISGPYSTQRFGCRCDSILTFSLILFFLLPHQIHHGLVSLYFFPIVCNSSLQIEVYTNKLYYVTVSHFFHGTKINILEALTK